MCCISQVFLSVVKLSVTRGSQESFSALSWPDEPFFNYVCNAKDFSGQFISILTSSILNIIQLQQSGTKNLLKAFSVDTQISTSLSMSLAALTSFFQQVLLLPIYSFTVFRTILLCRIQGIIALISSDKNDGFYINVMSSKEASAAEALVGICLTQSQVTDSKQTSDTSIQGKFSGTMGNLITSAAQNFVLIQLEPVYHIIDAVLSYFAGIVYKLGDVFTSFFQSSCLLPNVYLIETVHCACNDTEVFIPKVRASEGLEKKAHWCSGTLYITKSDGSGQTIYNPYSYEQLLSKMTNESFYDFLTCSEKSSTCVAPNDPIISAQGFNLIQIITKCRQNYLRKQWDTAAYVWYDQYSLDSQVQVLFLSFHLSFLAGL